MCSLDSSSTLFIDRSVPFGSGDRYRLRPIFHVWRLANVDFAERVFELVHVDIDKVVLPFPGRPR